MGILLKIAFRSEGVKRNENKYNDFYRDIRKIKIQPCESAAALEALGVLYG